MSKAKVQVIVDGEAVVFEGPPPSRIEAAWGLLEPALLGQGKWILACVFDGKDLLAGEVTEDGPFFVMKIETVPWEQACAQAISEGRQESVKTLQEIQTFGASMLVVPFANSLKEVDALVTKLTALLQPMEQALGFAQQFSAPWGERLTSHFERFQERLDIFSKAMQEGNVGLASEVLIADIKICVEGFLSLEGSPWVMKGEM